MRINTNQVTNNPYIKINNRVFVIPLKYFYIVTNIIFILKSAIVRHKGAYDGNGVLTSTS